MLAIASARCHTADSAFWIPSSLVYTDGVEDFGSVFDPSQFDDMDEPPPVHILYPRPGYKSVAADFVRHPLWGAPLSGAIVCAMLAGALS